MSDNFILQSHRVSVFKREQRENKGTWSWLAGVVAAWSFSISSAHYRRAEGEQLDLWLISDAHFPVSHHDTQANTPFFFLFGKSLILFNLPGSQSCFHPQLKNNVSAWGSSPHFNQPMISIMTSHSLVLIWHVSIYRTNMFCARGRLSFICNLLQSFLKQDALTGRPNVTFV